VNQINYDNKKSILISQGGLFIYGKIDGKPTLIGSKESSQDPNALLASLKSVLERENSVIEKNDKLQVIYHNDLFATVPSELFQQSSKRDYLKYNSRILATDQISSDTSGFGTTCVFVGYDNINNYLIDHIGSFDYFHLSSRLAKALETEISNTDPQAFLFLLDQTFYLYYIKDGKLIASNLFKYQADEDVLYYLLFTLEQNNAVIEEVNIQVVSDKDITSLISLLGIYIGTVTKSTDPELEIAQILCA
jgi:hypothetical protein